MSASVEEINAAIWDAIEHKTDFMHPRTKALHDEISRLNLDKYVESTVRAMIDSGQVMHVECHSDSCMLEDRTFSPKAGRSRTSQLSIEHVKPKRDGGANRIQNFTLLHQSCNSAWRRGTSFSPDIIEKIAAAQRGKVVSEEAKAKLKAAQIALAETPITCSTCHRDFRGPVGIQAHHRQSNCSGETK